MSLVQSFANQIGPNPRRKWRRAMQDLPHSEYTKAAAICVNLALDSIEGEIRKELSRAGGDSAETLRRLLDKLRLRRIDVNALRPVGSS